MSSAVCTLFEGDYHYGLAVLANSIYANGFRGNIYAGYKGTLPVWAAQAENDVLIDWKNNKVLNIVTDLYIIFLPIETEYHLTNYKPDFMLQLFNTVAATTDALLYFDPDIVVKCKWGFFETWVNHGIALVHEGVANDMPPTHPLRKEWEKVIEKSGKELTYNLNSYINGGFCGVSNKHKQFLNDWKKIFTTGIKFFNLTVNQWGHNYDRTNLFYAQDQDALNITAMCTNVPISEMGPEAMDFIPGGWIMSHSTGFSKPWKKKFITTAFKAIPPTQTDKLFWKYANGPIKPYSNAYLRYKSISMKIAAFIGRFYSRK